MLLFHSVLTSLFVGTTQDACQDKLLDSKMSLFKGNRIKDWSGSILWAVGKTWIWWPGRYCRTPVCNVCGCRSSFCSSSKFCCWSIFLWKVYAHVQGKTSNTFLFAVNQAPWEALWTNAEKVWLTVFQNVCVPVYSWQHPFDFWVLQPVCMKAE